MSSGINWKYKIVNGEKSGVPIQYSVGNSWTSGNGSSPDHDGMTVGLIFGLDEIRTAYAQLPGLAGLKEVWLHCELSGARKIVNDASLYLLDIAARKLGKTTPLVHGGCNIEERTVAQYFEDNAFVCGKEIAEFAGVKDESIFLENWEKLAIAAYEWPREKWGICPKVELKTLIVVDWQTKQSVSSEKAIKVLKLAEKWARTVKVWGTETPLTLGAQLAQV